MARAGVNRVPGQHSHAGGQSEGYRPTDLSAGFPIENLLVEQASHARPASVVGSGCDKMPWRVPLAADPRSTFNQILHVLGNCHHTIKIQASEPLGISGIEEASKALSSFSRIAVWHMSSRRN